MKNKTPKQIAITYKIKFVLIIIFYAVAVAALCWVISKNVLLGAAAMVMLAASVKAPFDKILETDIESIIYEELDPEKFNEVLSFGVAKRSTRLRVLGLMCAGKHDELCALIEESDKKTDNPLEKCNNIYRRGYVCFERGEFDKLPLLVQDFERLKKKNEKIAHLFNNYTVFDKYDAFADEDYEYVVDVCDIDLQELNPKRQNHKLTRINVSFYRAVSLYKMGRLNEAKEGFESIISFAPKMHKAKLSKDYIDLIKNN